MKRTINIKTLGTPIKNQLATDGVKLVCGDGVKSIAQLPDILQSNRPRISIDTLPDGYAAAGVGGNYFKSQKIGVLKINTTQSKVININNEIQASLINFYKALPAIKASKIAIQGSIVKETIYRKSGAAEVQSVNKSVFSRQNWAVSMTLSAYSSPSTIDYLSVEVDLRMTLKNVSNS